MTEAPKTARGHEEPVAVQFSVFLANRIGQLQDLMEHLIEHGCRLVGVSVVDSTDWAVIRLVLSDPDGARTILHARGLAYTENEVLVAELSSPGDLANICRLFVQAEVNVNFAYPLFMRKDGHPLMVLHVDDASTATQILLRHNVVLLGEADLTEEE